MDPADVKIEKRPGYGRRVATPNDEALLRLHGGGLRHEDVVVTDGQLCAIRTLYGFYVEPPGQKPPAPVPPVKPTARFESSKDAYAYERTVEEYKRAKDGWDRWSDPRKFMQAGADLSAMRFASSDGLRMLAWIARFIEPGADPVKTLIQLATDAGWDIDPDDVRWAEDLEEAADGDE